MSNAIIHRKPATDTTDVKASNHSQPRLHDARSIGLATLLAGPLAGGCLFAYNLKKLSRSGDAVLALIYCALASAGLAVLGVIYRLPDLGFLVSIGVAFGFQQIAKNMLGPEYEKIKSGQAEAHSIWIGVGLALSIASAMVISIGIVFLAII